MGFQGKYKLGLCGEALAGLGRWETT